MKSALKITLIYFIISFLWILFSDRFINSFSGDIQLLTRLQTYKGWFFVFSTSAFLYLLISREIARKNKLLNELKQARDKAEKSEKLKSVFLSNMSHEIRTPLNGILGFSQLLFENEADDETRQLYIDQVNRNNEQLLRIINNILAISKLQEKMVEPVFREEKPAEILEQIALNYQLSNSQLQNKKIDFNLKITEACRDLFFLTDLTCLNQILNNFIDNAIKYTPSGSITLGCRVEDEQLVIDVEDTGVGISDENLIHIFDRFIQLDEGRMVGDGFGLGLPISKGMAEVLGGKIEVRSQKGKGSCFSVLLPLKKA